MSEKKPTPLVLQPSVKVCPVCGTRTYSEASTRNALLIRPTHLASKWGKKKCPKCGSEPHVRRKECDCGHVFF